MGLPFPPHLQYKVLKRRGTRRRDCTARISVCTSFASVARIFSSLNVISHWYAPNVWCGNCRIRPSTFRYSQQVGPLVHTLSIWLEHARQRVVLILRRRFQISTDTQSVIRRKIFYDRFSVRIYRNFFMCGPASRN